VTRQDAREDWKFPPSLQTGPTDEYPLKAALVQDIFRATFRAY